MMHGNWISIYKRMNLDPHLTTLNKIPPYIDKNFQCKTWNTKTEKKIESTLQDICTRKHFLNKLTWTGMDTNSLQVALYKAKKLF